MPRQRSTPPPRDGIAPLNLRLEAVELRALLGKAVRSDAWEDAFLFAAALNQVAEDSLHRDVYVLGDASRVLRAQPARGLSVAGSTLGLAVSTARDVRARTRASRTLRAWQSDIAALVGVLASLTCHELSLVKIDVAEVTARARSMLAALERLPGDLHDHLARLPSCFQAFDLDVHDVRTMTDRFVATYPDRGLPLLVLGIRTSGGYLAPLSSVMLESLGYADVQWMTMRPQQGLLRHERDFIRHFAGRGGTVIVTDDPPASGSSVVAVANDVAQLGAPRNRIVLMLPLFGTGASPPALLREYPSLTLPEHEWEIRARLQPDVVGRIFERLCVDGTRVVDVTSVPLPERRRERDHFRALFRFDVVTEGRPRSLDVVAEGVGIGYFGRQSVVVADELDEYVPDVLGVDRNCLFRPWLPEEARGCPPGVTPGDELVEAIAGYVHERNRRLPVVRDRSVEAYGERPAWEVAGEISSRAFGRGAHVARVLLAGPLSRYLLRVANPCVVDGATAPSNWFVDEGQPERFLKVDFATRSFWNLGLLCYDPVYDLAGAAVGAGDDRTAGRLRSAYARLGGETVSEARWFLYELVQLWGLMRADPDRRRAFERQSARSIQRYLSHLFLADLEPSRDGELCVLDVDGVLETETLGFPGTTASGALALRALVAHGYCPLLVSGRSAADIADRCRTYDLIGGAGEYGAAVLTGGSEEPRTLLSVEQLLVLDRARADLAVRDGVELDEAYRYSVRAFRIDSRGRRRALHAALVEDVITRSGDGSARLRAVVGDSQTDFVATGIDKGHAVRALAEALGKPGEPRTIALAVGDTASDLPMLREAALAFAPAHARQALRGSGVPIVGAPYQAGLALAVGRLLGHKPGTCPVCRAPRLGEDDALLVSLLSATESGRARMIGRFFRLRRRLHTATAAGRITKGER